MKPPLRTLLTAAGAFLALLGSGCSSPAAADSAAAREAAELARREERQKIMQQYWLEHTATPGEAPAAASDGREIPPLLSYPAGTYDGLRFGPRRASDPSLAEPDR